MDKLVRCIPEKEKEWAKKFLGRFQSPKKVCAGCDAFVYGQYDYCEMCSEKMERSNT